MAIDRDEIDFRLTNTDAKTLDSMVKACGHVLNDLRSESKVVKEVLENLHIFTAQLELSTNLLNKADKAKADEVKNTEKLALLLNAYNQRIGDYSKNISQFNSKINAHQKKLAESKGAYLDIGEALNSKEWTKVHKDVISKLSDDLRDEFKENVRSLSSEGKEAFNFLIKKVFKSSESGGRTIESIVSEKKKIRIENELITEEKKAQANYTQTTLYGKRELNKFSKQEKKDAQETLQVEKQITAEIQKQTSTTKRKRGRPKKVKVVVEETTAPSATLPPATTTGSNVVPYRLGSLIPHPTLYRHPSTALTPLGIAGSRNSDKGDHLARMRSRIITDKFRTYYGGPSVVRAGASAPLLGLPQFSAEEQARREAKYVADNTPPVLGSVGPDEDEILRRQRRLDNYNSRAKSKGAYQVAHTGSAEPIMLGASSSAQGAGSPSSFEKQQQKEEDANNRRRFVTDLATAIIAAQKKNPIVDLLKWAVLIMGKHFPVLSAALITLAPLVLSLIHI